MTLLAWNSWFETGIDEVDRQHHYLVDRVNEVAPLLAEAGDQTPSSVKELFELLLDYADQHFVTEERLMQERGIDPRHARHHVESHRRFVDGVRNMASDYLDRNGVSGQELLGFVTNWLVFHILGEDQSMTRQIHLMESGVAADVAYGEEGDSEADPVRQALTQALIDLYASLSRMKGQREAEVDEIHRKLRIVADYTVDWETWIDPAGRYLYCSPSCQRLTGRAPQEFVDDPGLLPRLVHTDDVAAVANHFSRHASQDEQHQLTFRIRHVDGEWRWIEHQCQPVIDEHGKFLGRRASNREVTDRMQLLRQLADALQEAEKGTLAKSQFLANMSHEIRTPLNGIIGTANILRREGVTTQQAKRLDTIDASAQHLLSVINDVLDLSKIEAGKFTLEEVPVVVSSLLANVSSILAERVKAKGIHLLIETGHLPHQLLGDPTRLQQALLNYATNAVKFTETGTVTLRAFVQAEAVESATLRFEVQDTGIGIAPEAMSRLFSAFEQADNSMTRKYGGTGLGLAITKRLAHLMGGKVGADSTAGVGSTFWLTVRLKKGSKVASASTETAADAEAELRKHYAGKRILLVEDEPINREIAVMQIESVGLLTDAAEDGEQAVAMARTTRYSAIFMDMQMPKLNGVEATQQIRQIPGYQDSPIIAMTANAFAEDKAQCLGAGMDDFISKPVTPKVLFETLLKWLEKGAG